MRITKYLDDLIQIKHFKRDKQLAEWLTVSPAAVAQYRSGARSMSNEQCVAMALELGVDPLKVIMASDMDRAERAGQKSLWEVFSRRMATAE
jgi:DNA-binding transcriptional regulator YdaS (Cro superfamily)